MMSVKVSTMVGLETYRHHHRDESLEEAIRRATDENCTIGKYADPTEGARAPLTTQEALQIVAEDPALIWVGW